MSLKYPADDAELKDIVRADTGYKDNDDELPESALDVLIERAKARLQMKTGVNDGEWYADDGLGFALTGYACMRAKARVENISLSSYSIGQEDVTFDTDDPEDSQQLMQWAEDVSVGLDNSSVDQDTGNKPRNTADYIGGSYVREPEY